MVQNKYEGNNYHLTNNKGTFWVQRSLLIWASSWGISKGFHRRFHSNHQRRKELTFRSQILNLHIPLSTLTVIIRVSETLRAADNFQVLGGVGVDASFLCPGPLPCVADAQWSEPAAIWCVSWSGQRDWSDVGIGLFVVLKLQAELSEIAKRSHCGSSCLQVDLFSTEKSV